MPSFPEIDLSGLHPNTAATVRVIDEQASTMARRMLADGPSPAELRQRADSYEANGASHWLVATNRERADLLDRDARLAALMQLQAHDRACCENARHYELNVYERLLQAAISAARAPLSRAA